MKNIPIRRYAAFCLAALIVFFTLFPSLFGSWVLDDFHNLKGLATITENPTWREFAFFSLNGPASQIGRPVSMLSFALQHSAWPAQPIQFKVVNLALHLINGALIVLMTLRLGESLNWSKSRAWKIAMTASLLWMLHPMQVSTVAYIVQRMAELAAMFTLFGATSYLQGRLLLARGQDRSGYLWMSFGVVVCGGLAFFSKENGVLLLVYLSLIEWLLLRDLAKPQSYRAWQSVFLVLPLLTLSGYFVFESRTILDGYGIRDFTLTERLLTEPRVMWDYVARILVPRPSAYGVFFDDYQISRGILTPYTTLPAICGWLLAIVLAFRWRKERPILSFGVFWFLGGHLIESTFVALELYFEHRNYLPMFGLILAGTFYGVTWHERARRANNKFVILALSFIYTLGLAGISYKESELWGNSFAQSAIWAAEKPGSLRAQEYYAGALALAGKTSEAATVYARLAKDTPSDGRSLVPEIVLACFDSRIILPDLEIVMARLRNSRFSFGPTSGVEQILLIKEDGKCPRLPSPYLLGMIRALSENPNFSSLWAYLYFFEGRVHAIDGNLDMAMQAVDRANSRAPLVEFITFQIDWLVSAGLYDEAMEYVDKAQHLTRRKYKTSWYYNRELDRWRTKILELKGAKS